MQSKDCSGEPTAPLALGSVPSHRMLPSPPNSRLKWASAYSKTWVCERLWSRTPSMLVAGVGGRVRQTDVAGGRGTGRALVHAGRPPGGDGEGVPERGLPVVPGRLAGQGVLKTGLE